MVKNTKTTKRAVKRCQTCKATKTHTPRKVTDGCSPKTIEDLRELLDSYRTVMEALVEQDLFVDKVYDAINEKGLTKQVIETICNHFEYMGEVAKRNGEFMQKTVNNIRRNCRVH